MTDLFVGCCAASSCQGPGGEEIPAGAAEVFGSGEGAGLLQVQPCEPLFQFASTFSGNQDRMFVHLGQSHQLAKGSPRKGAGHVKARHRCAPEIERPRVVATGQTKSGSGRSSAWT